MKKALRLALAAAVSALGLWWALKGMTAERWSEAARHASCLWLLALVPAAMGIEFVLRAKRWGGLLPRSVRPSFRRVFSITAGGFFLNNILPFRAGEAARLLWTRRDTGTPAAACGAVLGLDRLFDMMALATVLFWVLSRWKGFPGGGRAGFLFGAGTAAVAIMLWAAARRPDRAVSLARGCRLSGRPLRWVEEFARGAAPLADPRLFLRLYLISMVFWGMNAVMFAAVSRVFGLGLSPTEGAALIVAFATGAALPSAPGYVGPLEAAGVALLSAAGRPREAAVPFILTLHAAQILSTAIFGVPSLFALSRKNIRKAVNSQESPSDPPVAKGAGLYGAPCAKKAHGWRARLEPGRLSDPSGGGKPTI
jgi:hypothetical protein